MGEEEESEETKGTEEGETMDEGIEDSESSINTNDDSANSNPTSTELLLRFGADPHQRRSTKYGGYSPLIHLAIAGPQSEWMNEDMIETVRLLLDAGADVNETDHEGWTPYISQRPGVFLLSQLLLSQINLSNTGI